MKVAKEYNPLVENGILDSKEILPKSPSFISTKLIAALLFVSSILASCTPSKERPEPQSIFDYIDRAREEKKESGIFDRSGLSKDIINEEGNLHLRSIDNSKDLPFADFAKGNYTYIDSRDQSGKLLSSILFTTGNKTQNDYSFQGEIYYFSIEDKNYYFAETKFKTLWFGSTEILETKEAVQEILSFHPFLQVSGKESEKIILEPKKTRRLYLSTHNDLLSDSREKLIKNQTPILAEVYIIGTFGDFHLGYFQSSPSIYEDKKPLRRPDIFYTFKIVNDKLSEVKQLPGQSDEKGDKVGDKTFFEILTFKIK